MTDTEINIAIAEACGWDCDPEEAREWNSRGQWCRKEGGENLISLCMNLPRYTTDLNAIIGAIRKLPIEQQQKVHDSITALVGLPHIAKAPQWCETYLRTLNLYTS